MFNIVGLFDTNLMSNLKIMKETHTYVAECSPEEINLLIFVFKKGRYTPEEKQLYELYISRWKHEVSSVSALVIMDCDNDDESSRRDLVEDFRSNPITSDAANFMKKGIYTVGFLHKGKNITSDIPSTARKYRKRQTKNYDIYC